jgi:UDP-N-acetylmuramoylalanine-D-glutamate ligase
VKKFPKLIASFFQKTNAEKVMDEIVEYSSVPAADGDVILLSSVFSSLDWFQNYAERGKTFEKVFYV